jgi:SulP family sulfate permease
VLGSRLKWAHPAVLPVTLLAASAVFFIGARSAGIDFEQARSLGWMFEAVHVERMHLPLSLSWSAVNWGVIGNHYSELGAMIAVVTLTILLNSTGLGLATRRDIDFNHELRSAGMANLVTGLLGGVVGCQSVSRTLLGFHAGARGRATGVLAALACLFCVMFLSQAIALMPKPVLAGMLLGLGVMMLIEWLVKSRRQLSRTEYFLIVAILAVIAAYGFVAGVALGIVVACMLFVVEYGRISCIKLEFSGSSLMSKVERPIEVGALLQQHGARVYGLCLQGFLFFGSANQVVNRVREELKTPRAFIVIDFRRVQGLDASTSQSFTKLAQICAQCGAVLVLTGLQHEPRLQIADAGGLKGAVREFDDLDTALEWLEEDLLSRLQNEVGHPDLSTSLAEHFDPASLQRLLDRTDVLELPADTLLFRSGDAGDCMYFIERGRVSISLTSEGGEKMRLRSFDSGTIVGEMSLYTGQQRTADVTTDGPAQLRKLTATQLRALEAEDPATALQLHNFIVKVMAKRLRVTNEAYRLAF